MRRTSLIEVALVVTPWWAATCAWICATATAGSTRRSVQIALRTAGVSGLGGTILQSNSPSKPCAA